MINSRKLITDLVEDCLVDLHFGHVTRKGMVVLCVWQSVGK